MEQNVRDGDSAGTSPRAGIRVLVWAKVWAARAEGREISGVSRVRFHRLVAPWTRPYGLFRSAESRKSGKI